MHQTWINQDFFIHNKIGMAKSHCSLENVGEINWKTNTQTLLNMSQRTQEPILVPEQKRKAHFG